MGADGRPRILERFKANVLNKQHEDMIIPVQTTGLIGMKLIKRLREQGRISSLPQMLYLDSAHEADETYLELQIAWRLLPPCGVLYGDDWNWEAVQTDVWRFVEDLTLAPLTLFDDHLQLTQPVDGIGLLGKSQWFIQKPPSEHPTSTSKCKVDGKAWY